MYFIKGSGQIIISGLVNKRIASFEILKDLGYGPFKSVSCLYFIFYINVTVINIYILDFYIKLKYFSY